jgi:hypothetical protein
MYWIIVKYLNVSVGSTEVCDGRKELYGREVTILACALGRIQIQSFKYYEEIAVGWHVMVRAILKDEFIRCFDNTCLSVSYCN